ncbi:hypothetical protein UFOVP917_33 [uncultured Caudovirales phage]|uniref:Uncharacterized protein n=1 Tax=uncultured Caudovirales phage TaxID=2100421 RepID=A0A6J5LS92_9CAUD|nr:hypothetical protein UFOVP297_11 [uncultured Caudovirales phage]CAB4171285.1 hypothetical protein UFOVP917_33 [uncultured Caudovirales phage]CAB4182997.1 hypothetical protein UFOVP1094_35 [uncultured Caudovirales phage]CAB4200390.1 hypothetical protein UFOVP1342_35 [uncultured Caudovirales phage]CAB4213455.1 hypothetical protein UFOVP1450_23 [uncultured Caudovirales phage]
MLSLNGKPPEIKTRWNCLNLGAGVQSSTLALMAAAGEISPMPDFAIFADTQAEPDSVYSWLDWLERQLPFPVHRVTRGNMTDDMMVLRTAQDGRQWTKSMIPAFMQAPNGSIGLLGRSCTADYKIVPILKKLRQLCGIKRGEKQVQITQWIGISYDEIQRMKPSRDKWTQHRWPLIEREMRRHDCIVWLKRHGFPEPPRSACIYCPFHSNAEWRRLKDHEPEAFAEAVRVEQELQSTKAKAADRSVPWLHRSCVPLEQVDLSTETDAGQLDMFGNECEGLCGV